MGNRNCSTICAAADKTAAQAICTAIGDGPGTFSIPLSTTQGVTNPALATHWGMSGYIIAEEADALDKSLAPMVKVFDLVGAQEFNDHLVMCTPPLFRIYEEL